MDLSENEINIINAKVCPYCKSETKVVSETEIYGREYKGRKMIACVNFPKCDSYVGTHDDETPLGRLANKSLRERKKQAHFWFDKLWKQEFFERSELYEKLSEFLKIPREYTHIGMFGIATCIKTENWAIKIYYELSTMASKIEVNI